jgi:hypothetical protein
MVTSDSWCVAVFKCKPEEIGKWLVEFYRFVEDLEGVESLHFLIRDRLDDEVVFSFRIKTTASIRKVVKSKLTYKLGTFLPKEKYSIDPDDADSLKKYVAWDYERRIAESGQEAFDVFCEILDRMSKFVVCLIEEGYFTSKQRVELAHVMSWMLGCTEYGLLSTKGFEIGYYDRIDHKYCSYLRQELKGA